MPEHRVPISAINFCAKGGFLTKEIWSEFFFTGNSLRMQNWHWQSLIKKKYFIKHSNARLNNVYVLNRKNKSLMSLLNGNIARTPHEGQISHDEILLRGLLIIEKHKLMDDWTTEMLLKTFERDTYKTMSRGKNNKFPDAIIHLNRSTEPYKVAIELELTSKDKKRYIQILNAYSAMKDISMILFITSSAAIQGLIRRTAEMIYFPEKKISIGFMNLKEWKNNPVLAEVKMRTDRTFLKNICDSNKE